MKTKQLVWLFNQADETVYIYIERKREGWGEGMREGEREGWEREIRVCIKQNYTYKEILVFVIKLFFLKWEYSPFETSGTYMIRGCDALSGWMLFLFLNTTFSD